ALYSSTVELGIAGSRDSAFRSFIVDTDTKMSGDMNVFLGLGAVCFSVRKRLTGRRHLRGSVLFPFLSTFRYMT
ncbi:hypothetical protein THAOC_28009, partial [Thalassiosira oceanica]